MPDLEVNATAAKADAPDRQTELATLGGGCFWCLEAVYEQLEGVTRVRSGYAGGHVDRPSYQAVCMGVTGHAEVVQVEFDPAVIGFKDILEVFFVIHDPTQLNRQGNDVGTQYRSVIFYHSEEQRETASAVIQALLADKVFSKPIVTELAPLDTFYPAEPHHAEYYRRNPGQPYCQVVVGPKVAKFRKNFQSRIKKEFAS